MQLTYFTVSNYRSITTAYKINMQNITILIGKNNEGKSNLIKALNLAMDILQRVPINRMKRVPHQLYNWREDFPIDLQDKRSLKKKNTELRLDFHLDQAEIGEFHDKVGSVINGDLSIFVEIRQDETLSITVPKRGKNATALTTKLGLIAEFICEHIYVQYIPAIRSESDAYDVISCIVEEELRQTGDEEYQKAQKYIDDYQEKRLAELSKKIKDPLATFMPSVKSVRLHLEERSYMRMAIRKSVSVEIDDGVMTNLSQKGDGVKSLTTMAILSQTDAKNRIVIIDEPEAYLHPESIHYLKKVLFTLADNNQLIISTHNPIFVNRLSIASNIIVEKREAKSANRIDQIRKILGVRTADNLMYSDYIVIVEGPSDKIVIEKFLKRDSTLAELLKNNFITVRSIGGVNNLQSEIYNLERYMCSYMAVLDSDDAGKEKAKVVQEHLGISSNRFRYFMVNSKPKKCELEDLYKPEAYRELLLNQFGLDISSALFNDKRETWCTRIKKIATSVGQELSEAQLNEIKTLLSNEACNGLIEDWFLSDAIILLEGIIKSIKIEVNRLFSKFQ